jgi:hypothetical protein
MTETGEATRWGIWAIRLSVGVKASLFTMFLMFGFQAGHSRAQGRVGLRAGFQTEEDLRDRSAATIAVFPGDVNPRFTQTCQRR